LEKTTNHEAPDYVFFSVSFQSSLSCLNTLLSTLFSDILNPLHNLASPAALALSQLSGKDTG